MKIHYRIQDDFIEIVRCFGTESFLLLPESISGYTVRKVAPYTFSAKKGEEDEDVLVYETDGEGLCAEHGRLLAGMEIEAVVLPDTIEEIGRYTFYGCGNMQRLEFSDSLVQVGCGAFTGCGQLRTLNVRLRKGERSCVKEILGELWQRIDVTFIFHGFSLQDGISSSTGNIVKLVFPEHYEEAVENTPARILFTRHHGTGNNYRQCFYDRKMDYRKYDALFSLAAAQDRPDVLVDLIFCRLEYTYALTREHERLYEHYVREHLREFAPHLVEQENMDRLHQISERGLWEEAGMEEAIRTAAESGKSEMLSFLMNEKHCLFPEKKQKRFEL